MNRIYNRCCRTLKESRNYFLFVLVLFTASLVLGMVKPVFFIDFIRTFVEDLLKQTENFNFLQMFFFILNNNLTTAFFVVAGGLFFGIIPVVLTFFNGYVSGFVIGKSIEAVGAGVLWRLVPHGIFEIPALIISLGMGLKLGTYVFAKEKTKKKFLTLIEDVARVFLFLIIPLLVIAALIETGLILFVK